MKDDAVERVLQELGRAEIPAGLEGRVLRRLAESGSQRASGWGLGLRLVGGLALAGVLAWCVGSLGHGEGGHAPGAKARFAGGAERPKAEALGYLHATAKAAPDEERSGAGGLGSLPATAKSTPHVERFRVRGLAFFPAEPDMLDSFPAPAASLTEQERLLVRIARHPQRSDAQFLIAEVREAELARGDAEFERFFPAPKAEEGIEVSQPVQAKENHNEVQPKDR